MPCSGAGRETVAPGQAAVGRGLTSPCAPGSFSLFPQPRAQGRDARCNLREMPRIGENMIPALMPTYNRADLAFERGEGAWL